jgi:hypothetical protein
MDSLTINTRTTGFGSPARAYAKKRLDLNELIIKDPYATFFFLWEGDSKLGLNYGDYLVIDRSVHPNYEDLVIWVGQEKLEVDYFGNIDSKKLWGTITWKISSLKK